ncbi:MAG TPA: four helix bundle protein [Cytophagaceae bacterium]
MYNSAIYQKAVEIVKITESLIHSFDDRKDKLKLKEQMVRNAKMIPAKIAGAEAMDLYSLKMENAILIKIAARELLADSSLCRQMELCEKDYLSLLKNEIELFRLLYLEWVNSFDRSNDIDDGWS